MCEAAQSRWTAAENSNLWDAQSSGGGTINNNWDTDFLPDANDLAVFDSRNLIHPIRTIHLNGNRALDSVIFQEGAQFTLGTVVGAETLTIGAGSELSGYSLASSVASGPTWNLLNCNVAMNDTSGDNTFAVYAIPNHELRIRGVVSGSNRLLLTGGSTGGTLVLSNANTYSGGTTIALGNLRVANTTGSGTGTGAVTVESAGTLSGTGRVGGAITVNANGTIAPGASIGTLTALSGVTLNGKYACEIGGTAADRLAVTGTLNVRNGILNVSQTSPWIGTSFTIATAAQVQGPFATVSGLPSGYSIFYGSTSIIIRPSITFHVDAGAAPGGTGTNWGTALDTIDEALTLVGWGEQIWVKEGVYVPGDGSTNPSSTFRVPDGIQLLGGFAGTETSADQRDPAAHLTVLSGDLGNDDTGKVNGITSSPAGIQGSNAYSVVTISFAAPVIDGFTITGGSAPVTPIGNPGGESRGGGVFVDTDFARVPTLSNCRLYGNTAVQGGAIFIHSLGGCHIVSCDFRSNRSSGRGGAAYYWWSNVRTTNCNFSGNVADDDGGAIFDDPQGNGSTVYVNCTFTGNSANDLGGAIANSTGATTVRQMHNTVIWNNRAQGVLTNANSSVSSSVGYDFTNCLVQNVNLTGTGAANLDGTDVANDPGFFLPLDPSLAPTRSGDFRPSSDAAIINAGNNSAIAGISLDLSGEPRILKGTVDLGAYEIFYPPTAVSIVPATTGPTSVTSLAFTVLFSEAVTNFNALADLVVGATGTANASGAGFSGSGSNYIVTLTGVSGSGNLTLAVNTNSDVRDLFGNFLASSVTSAPVTLDHTPPAATGITPATTGPTNVTSLSFAVLFSEAVTNFNALADLVIGTTGTANASGAGFSGSGSNYTVTLSGVSGSGTLTLAVSTNSDVRDLLGNLLASSVTSAPVTLDHTAPAVASITPSTTGPTNITSLAFTVLFSEAVTNFDSLTDVGFEITGSVSVGGSSFSGSGSNYAVTLTGLAGDGTLALRVKTTSGVQDLAGNPLVSSVTSTPVVLDLTAPKVTSITPPTTEPTNASSLQFTVLFGEPVVNFDTLADLVVGTTGTANFSGASLSGSGTIYTVTLTGLTGDGTLTLAVSTSSDVSDLLGNLLVASTTSEPVTLDHTPPAVTSITPATTGPTIATSLNFTITFSEAVVNFNALADLVIGTSGTLSVGGALFSGTGSNHVVTVTNLVGAGTLTLAVATNSGVQDVAGNALASTISSALVTFVVPATPAVLHWPFDEGGGTNTIELASGQTNVAFLTGPVAWTGGLAPGRDHAIDLNIDSPNSSYVDAGTLTTNGVYVAGSDPGYRVLQNNWSITAWVRLPSPQVTGGDRVIASSDTGGDSTWWLFFVQYSAVQENLGFDFNSTRVHSGLSLPLNQTVFVAITADNSGASFPGGTNKHQFAVWNGTTWQTSLGTEFDNIRLQGLEIGSFNSGLRQFDGVIDDVRIYNQTLTQAELDDLVAQRPTLTIAPAGTGQLQISWAPDTAGYFLQETLSLSPASWSNAPSGITNPIVVPSTLPARFYRLFKP